MSEQKKKRIVTGFLKVKHMCMDSSPHFGQRYIQYYTLSNVTKENLVFKIKYSAQCVLTARIINMSEQRNVEFIYKHMCINSSPYFWQRHIQ